MAESENQTPDLVAAGVPNEVVDNAPLRGAAAYSNLGGGLVDALRGQQGINPGLLQAMMPAPQTNGQVYASALAGGVSGMRGQQNPVDLQYQRQVEMQQNAAGNMDRMMERQRVQQEKTREAEKTLSESLLKSENLDAQQTGARGLAGYYRATTGRTVPPQYFIEKAKLSGDDLKTIRGYIVGERSDAEILALYPNVKPEFLQAERGNLDSAPYRKAHGIETKAELLQAAKTDALKRRDEAEKRKDEDLKRDSYRFFSDNPEITDARKPYVAEFIRGKTGGRLQDVDTSTPEGRALLTEATTFAKSQLAEEKDRDSQRRVREAAARREAGGGSQTGGEFQFKLLQERQQLMAKGVLMTPQERLRLAAIDDHLERGGARGGGSGTSGEKGGIVSLTQQMALQPAVKEIQNRLPRDASPTMEHNGEQVLKSKWIEDEYARRHPGQRIQVQWSGAEFTVVGWWETKTTTRGKVAKPETVLGEHARPPVQQPAAAKPPIGKQPSLERAPAGFKEGQRARGSDGRSYRSQGGFMVPE